GRRWSAAGSPGGGLRASPRKVPARPAEAPQEPCQRACRQPPVRLQAQARGLRPRAALGVDLMASVQEILDGKQVAICAGSGGVGKTTTSAAIAAGLAARGKKVAVLTIDPAKRLADSLG